MIVPPSGIVTFLLTDIEGSTRLWEQQRAAMARAARRHDILLGEAVAAHNGVLFKHVGDAVQAAFASAEHAVAAAVAAQRAMATEPWPETGPIRVRMGIHRGEAAPNAKGDYHQIPCLNRAHRLMSAGHGGQVLLSGIVRDAVGGSLPGGVTLRDLGRHRLRDLLEPEQIAQLVIAGLPDVFPPLKTLEGHANNLPTLPTALIGRETELAALADLLHDDGPRLLTLVGPGGVGKTHLALQTAADAAERFADGVWLIRLGEVHTAEQIVPAIAAVLAVREGGGLTTEEALHHWIGARRVLLVLDNLEQIVGAGRAIAALLAATPHARILATSRQRLRTGGEQVFAVEPLPCPTPDEAERIGENAAARLFVERAEATAPGAAAFERDAALIAAVCARLDGLPLAIELAAAQLRTHTLPELLRDLEQSFALLTGGRPEGLSHQQSLEATIAWSYDRLEPDAQRLLRHCAVFAGGWSREAAAGVVGEESRSRGVEKESRREGESATLKTEGGSRESEATSQPFIPSSQHLITASPATLLATLAEQSLIRRTAIADESRWSMLESIRAFALDRLEATGESREARRRHAAWCLALAEAAAPHLAGADQIAWLQQLDLEHDNARAALRWYAEIDDSTCALTLAAALAPYWQTRGLFSEGRRWLEAALERKGAPPAMRLQAMNEVGVLAQFQGDNAAARTWYDTALAAARASEARETESVLLNNLGAIALECGELDEAEQRFAESLDLATAANDPPRRADALANLGAAAHYKGDPESALRRYLESLRIWSDLEDSRGIADMRLNVLLLLAPRRAARGQALAAGEDALRRFQELGEPQGEALVLAGLGLVESTAGNLDRAAELQEASLRLAHRIEDRATEARVVGNLVAVEIDRKRYGRAAELIDAYFPLVAALGDRDGMATGFEAAATLHVAHERYEQAAQLAGAAHALRQEIAMPALPEGHERYATVLAILQQRLGDRFDGLCQEGAAFSHDEAISAARRREARPPVSDPLAELLLTLDDTLDRPSAT